MKKFLLSDLCEIGSGGTPSRGNADFYKGKIPWAKISDIENAENGILYNTEEKISIEGLKSIRNKLFPKGTLLFAMYGSIGKVAIAGVELSTNQAILGIRPKNTDQVHLKYLKIWFERNKQKLINQGRGVALQNLSATIIRNLEVPLPPLTDQIRIAAILTHAEKLIAKRKESIKALDELLKSTFLEMFGLNNTDYKKWKIEPLSASTEIVSGVTKGKKYGSSILRAVPYMRVANVQDGHLNLSEIKTIEVTEKEIRQYELKQGDLLLTEGGDPDKLGRGAVWNDEIEECIHQNHIFRVRAKDASINPVFLSSLMASKYGKSYFLKAAKQTTGIASINSTQLKAFPLIKPPEALQNQFSSIVTKVESLKSKYIQSLASLENLYGSLSQRAFKGELDLSKVPKSVDCTEPTKVTEAEQTPKHLPEQMRRALEDLNAFNNSTNSLRALQEAARLTTINIPQIDEMKRLAEQMAKLSSPLEELKRISSITDNLPNFNIEMPAIDLFKKEQLEAFRATSELAKRIQMDLPKIDMGFLEQQKKLMEQAMAPFEAMKKNMAEITKSFSPAIDISFLKNDYAEAAKRIRQIIPDYSSVWKTGVLGTEGISVDDEDDELPKRPFTIDDIKLIMSQSPEPLTFDNLLTKLRQIETINLSGYEVIKGIIFELLENGTLKQSYNDTTKSLQFSIIK